MSRNNFSGWDMKKLEGLKRDGKVRGFRQMAPEHPTPAGRIVAKHFEQRSEAKDYIAWNLLYWANEHAVQLQSEYKFHPERKWRFDWFIDLGTVRIGIEYNGLMSDKSRHTTVGGYTGDMNKINAAQALGIRVLQFTPLNYESLITELNKLLWTTKIF